MTLAGVPFKDEQVCAESEDVVFDLRPNYRTMHLCIFQNYWRNL